MKSPEEIAALTIPEIVDLAAAVRAQIEPLKAELASLESHLIKRGGAKYTGASGAVCQVISQSAGKPSYKLAREDDAETEAKKIAGDHFRNLFDRVVSFKPCQGFADVLPKLLSPARQAKLLELTTVAGKAGSVYTRWTQAPAADPAV